MKSNIRHRIIRVDGTEAVLYATSDDEDKITDMNGVKYDNLEAFAMGHTTSEGITRVKCNAMAECEIEVCGHWFPLDMRSLEWLPLDMKKQ